MGGRENSLPRYCFITFGTTLDNRELVLLAGENRCFPCQSHSNAIPHTLTSVQPAGGPSEGKRREGWLDEGRQGWRDGGRALKNKPDCKEENLLSIVSSSQSTAHCSFGHPNVFAIKVF